MIPEEQTNITTQWYSTGRHFTPAIIMLRFVKLIRLIVKDIYTILNDEHE